MVLSLFLILAILDIVTILRQCNEKKNNLLQNRIDFRNTSDEVWPFGLSIAQLALADAKESDKFRSSNPEKIKSTVKQIKRSSAIPEQR